MLGILTGGGTRMVGAGVLMATFLVGALAGAAVDRVLSADEADASRDGRDDDERSYVIDEVEMSTEQRATIDGILERRSQRMRDVWRESAPRLSAITDSARIEIMDVLTPEQQAEYERRLDERREKRRDRGDRDVDTDDASGDSGAADESGADDAASPDPDSQG